MLRLKSRNAALPDAKALAALRPYGGVVAQLLYARGVMSAQEAAQFLHPSTAQLHDPMSMHDVAEAVKLFAQAKENAVPAVVYGDYDVDGMCASAILTDALRRYGVEASPHVPLREEGYGLNEAAVRKLAKSYRLLITVDLGITNHSEVALAKELGMTVIVTDHHQLGLVPCPADAVVSPLMGAYPCPKLCGAGVAFKLAQALLGHEETLCYLDLAALATVADIVPLTDENRTLVALGLPVISARERVGLRALMKISGAPEQAAGDTLGFQLAPRLNAAGRLGNAADGVRLLLTTDPAEAEALAVSLDELNTRRRKMEQDVLGEAQMQAKNHNFVKNPALIVRREGWHTGVIGLAAGRLCRSYGCPTVVLSEHDGMLHGSLRSVPGVNIHRCLQACDDLMTRYGGHEQAAGCTLPAENYEEFYVRMQQSVREAATEECLIPTEEYDLPIDFADVNDALIRDLALLAPFGMGNPAPLFLAQNLRLERRRACGADGSHLQLTLRSGSQVLDGIAFGMGKAAASLPQTVDAVLSLKHDTFRGVTAIKCEAKALRPAAGAEAREIAEAEEARFENALLDALLKMKDSPSKEGKTDKNGEEYLVVKDGGGSFVPVRGTLYIAHTRKSAQHLLSALPNEAPDVCWYAADDPLCFPTLLLLPLMDEVSGHWQRVVLLDGEAFRGEAARWRQMLPHAQIEVYPCSAALKRLAAEVDAGDDAYRILYRALRKRIYSSLAQAAEDTGLSVAQCRTGLHAFAQLKLIQYTESPFFYALCPPSPCRLQDSALLCALRTLAEG